MMAQVTAAALVSESKLLTHPASTDSIPTNNEKEDHVSMGPWAARKAKSILENTEYVLSIEAIAACQALEFRKPLQPNRGARLLTQWIRSMVPPMEKDRILSTDVEAVAAKLKTGDLQLKIRKELPL
jgi:histidine ammonia-lyase